MANKNITFDQATDLLPHYALDLLYETLGQNGINDIEFFLIRNAIVCSVGDDHPNAHRLLVWDDAQETWESL